MLGKLARWLRILGYDTVYDNFAEDDDLLALAESQDRVLLTRDRPLVERAEKRDNVSCLHIDDETLDAQLAQLVTDVDLDLGRPTFTRCLECNVSIRQVSPEDVVTIVPPHVYKAQTAFFRCPSCQRVFWAGSHTERMDSRLASIRKYVHQREAEQISDCGY